MANRDNTGFRPARSTGAPHVILRYPIDSSNGTNVFVGDVVTANAAGSVRPAAAGDATSVAGIVVALYDNNSIPVGAPASLTANKYLGSSTAGYADVALALPGVIFIAQGQSGQTYAASAVNATTDHVAGTGVTSTATSGHELDLSDLNTGGQFIILGIVNEPNNSAGINTDLYVMFNESIFAGTGKAVGV